MDTKYSLQVFPPNAGWEYKCRRFLRLPHAARQNLVSVRIANFGTMIVRVGHDWDGATHCKLVSVVQLRPSKSALGKSGVVRPGQPR